MLYWMMVCFCTPNTVSRFVNSPLVCHIGSRRTNVVHFISNPFDLPITSFSLFAGERCQVYPDIREERQRRLEFNTSAISILNSLEYMGYRVVTSGSFVASQTNNNKVGVILRIIILQPTFSVFLGKQTQIYSKGVYLDCSP